MLINLPKVTQSQLVSTAGTCARDGQLHPYSDAQTYMRTRQILKAKKRKSENGSSSIQGCVELKTGTSLLVETELQDYAPDPNCIAVHGPGELLPSRATRWLLAQDCGPAYLPHRNAEPDGEEGEPLVKKTWEHREHSGASWPLADYKGERDLVFK